MASFEEMDNDPRNPINDNDEISECLNCRTICDTDFCCRACEHEYRYG